jgi:chitodextrinase
VSAQVTWNSATVEWTTPGDDSIFGQATQFDLRYSTAAITASNFGNATAWTPMPSPATSGTKQSVTLTGLTSNTTYWVAIKTVDDAGNWSALSNVLQFTTASAPDVVRPAMLALSITSLSDTTATLGWVATGDDSLTGTATGYDVRFSTSAITSSNWANATQANNEPAPTAPGSNQSFVVRGLSRQTRYYFAARVRDEAGNQSALSNVPSGTTTDTMAPAAIKDLTIGWMGFGWRSSLMAMRERRNGSSL